MNLPASFPGGRLLLPLARCTSCSVIYFQPLAFPPIINPRRSCNLPVPASRFSRFGKVVCKMSETETEPNIDNDETTERSLRDVGDHLKAIESVMGNHSRQDEEQSIDEGKLESKSLESQNGADTKTGAAEDDDNYVVASGSPLPGVKPQQLDESIRIPKEKIDILRGQVFGFDTFFVTSHEPYEGGVLFKGNLRGQASKSYEKILMRMQDRFGDLYKLFLLINPEDDKPVAVVVPKMTLQPDTIGAVKCKQCKSTGVNSVDHFNGQFKAGGLCWLCRVTVVIYVVTQV